MGMQFWWFYDVAAVAIILVAVFLSARKPISKAIASLMALVLGLLVAMPASSSMADSIYKNTIRNSNIDKIQKTLEEESLTQKTKAYIESLGYKVVVKEDKLENIFKELGSDSAKADVYDALYKYVNNINGRSVDTEEAFDEKMAEGFAEMISDIVSEELSLNAAEAAAAAVIENPESINEFLILSQQEYMTDAAEYIEDNYTAASYMDIVKLLCFIILLFVIVVAVKFFAHAILGKESEFTVLSIGEHIGGGVIGLFIGAFLVFIAAVAVRTYTIFGSGEMLFFNNEVIDKTLLFRYVYELAAKL